MALIFVAFLKRAEAKRGSATGAPLTDILSNHFYADLEKLYELKPYLEVVHSRTGQRQDNRPEAGTG